MRVKATHCKKGHELTDANVYRLKDGRRYCRICANARSKANSNNNVERRRQLQREWWARNKHRLRKKKTQAFGKQKKIANALRAYRRGETIASIEKRTGIPNQTLYKHLAKRNIERQRRARGYLALCWWCGAPLVDKRSTTCGERECLEAAGLPVPWTAAEDAVIEHAAGICGKAGTIARTLDLPGRTHAAIASRIKKMRSRHEEQLAEAA